MPKMHICLWSNDQAEAMARFYRSVFKGSKLGRTAYWGPNPMGVTAGSVLTMALTLRGQRSMRLNGFTKVREIDFYWKKLLQGGGKPVQCGWLIDRFGVRWQVYPAECEKWNSSKNKRKKQAVTAAMWKMVKLDHKKLKAASDQA